MKLFLVGANVLFMVTVVIELIRASQGDYSLDAFRISMLSIIGLGSVVSQFIAFNLDKFKTVEG